MHNLVAYKDFHYPRFLQIIPAESQQVMMPERNLKSEVIGHKPGRITGKGLIDIVTISGHEIKIGDQMKTPWSVLRVEEIVESRPPRGEYPDKTAIWMRIKFTMVKSLVNA